MRGKRRFDGAREARRAERDAELTRREAERQEGAFRETCPCQVCVVARAKAAERGEDC